MTLEELEEYVLSLNGQISNLEAQVEQLENQLEQVDDMTNRVTNHDKGPTSLILIDVYDLTTKSIQKTAVLLKIGILQAGAKLKWLSDGDNFILSSPRESILFEESNKTGIYRQINLKDTGDASMFNKDLMTGGAQLKNKTFYNNGFFSTERGSIFILHKQRVV